MNETQIISPSTSEPYQLAILFLTLLTVLVGYFQRNWIRAFLQFYILDRDIEVGLIQTRDKHIDIGSEGLEDNLGDSRGIEYTRLRPADSTNSLISIFKSKENRNTRPITVEEGSTELFLFVMCYNANPGFNLLGNVRFKPMHWWVHTWPPETFTILGPPSAVETEPENLVPSDTSLHTHDSLLLKRPTSNSYQKEWSMQSVYENTAYAPSAEKRYAHIRRGSLRCELDAYTAGHNIFTPVWLDIPKLNHPKPRWINDNEEEYKLRIVIDPPNVPFQSAREVPLKMVESTETVFKISDADPRQPLIKRVGPENEEAKIAIICCIHGDEPCGRRAIEKLLSVSDNLEWHKPVKFILANPVATKREERFVDTDLNRVFKTQDDDSDALEVDLADEILGKIDDCQVLDLHSTDSTNTPFGLIAEPEATSASPIKSTGLIEHAVDVSYIDGGLQSVVDGVTVECGYKQTDSAASTAYQILHNFLISMGVLDGETEPADPEWYKIYDDESADGKCKFTGKNFEPVEKGEVFARGENDELVASERFIPILMADSTQGYDDILGYKAEKESEPNFNSN